MTDATKPPVSERLRELAKQITKAADTSGVTHINAKGSAEHVRALATEIELHARTLRRSCGDPQDIDHGYCADSGTVEAVADALAAEPEPK